MNILPKTLESKAKIRFQDCDPFNHLNNASYLDYFMNHREDQLIEKYNVDIYRMAKTEGKSWVVGTTQIAYLKPALLMETVTMESQLIHFTNTKLQVEMRMYNESKTQLKAILWCNFVHFNLLKQQREQHNNDLIQLFESVCTNTNYTSFENRLQSLKPKQSQN